MKWRGYFSGVFTVQRRIRQGSVLSPYLLNIFINQLLFKYMIATLVSLQVVSYTIDDISRFSLNPSGLQSLIDICVQYSLRWPFKFNASKSMCMIVGKCPLTTEPEWIMNRESLCNVSRLEVLGNVFSGQGTCSDRIQQRITKCGQSWRILLFLLRNSRILLFLIPCTDI